MTNNILPNPKQNPSKAKRKRIIAAVAQELVNSEDDDNVADGVNICNIIESEGNQRKQTATSCALHALGETIKNTLLEINEMREQNRERRHRELLQILEKMVQQENTAKIECDNSKVTNMSNEVLNYVKHANTNRYGADQDFTEEDLPNSNDVASDSCSSPTREYHLSHSHHKPQVNKEQNSKIKNGVSVKNDDTKGELQKMRARMLELQRQKMEDRERKKREFLKVTST